MEDDRLLVMVVNVLHVNLVVRMGYIHFYLHHGARGDIRPEIHHASTFEDHYT